MGPHMAGSVDKALLHRGLGPRIDVVLSEPRFDGGDTGHVVRASVGCGGATVHDAGFIQMDMGLYQARRDEQAADVALFSLAIKVRFDGHDGFTLNGDIHQRCLRRYTGDTGVA